MKNIVAIILGLFVSQLAFGQKAPEVMKTAFPDSALTQPLFDMEGLQTTTGAVLEAPKGKTVLLYIWAMWCPDCLEGFPALQAFQATNPDVEVVYFSLDREEQRWKDGIEKFQLTGDHYWFKTGWKNAFTNSIDLNWIPRYLIVDPQGGIATYYAVDASDPALQAAVDALK